MKKSLILVFVFFYSISLFAKCGNSGIRVFPKSEEISTNSQFMIEGFAMSQQIIRNLNKENSIYLESNSHIVKLKVVEIREGEFRLTQAILKLDENLKQGEEYALKIDGLKNKVSMYKYNQYGKKVSWRVNDSIDKKKPFWKSYPKLIEKTYERFGCGPAIYATFGLEIEDKSETLVKTEVMDLETNKTTIYYLQSKEGKLDVGHGMCSGAFGYKNNGKYKVRFNLLDASGNSLEKWTGWINFSEFSKKMEMPVFSKKYNWTLVAGVLLFLIAIFFKRHSDKV